MRKELAGELTEPGLDQAKATLLIVDDTPANLRLLSSILADRGYQVRPVLDGQLALASVAAQPPDMVLLDIRMPEMSGYEVCERLKADPGTRDIPVIFLSAMDAVEDKVKAFAVGGVDYITKPFQIEEVLARVEAHLTLSRLREQLQRANSKMSRELELAGEVQRSFLPSRLPALDGWEIAVRLEPARETSGDFYDVRLLPGGKVSILVADVVDKGVGAALFMALIWVVIRTYAEEYPAQPERVMSEVNRRLLDDTGAKQFATVFYGVLDPSNGTLTYCNAGHPPALLARGAGQDSPQELGRTGLPIGLFDGALWDQVVVELDHGNLLVAYTDGITEACDPEGAFFDEEGLHTSLRNHLGATAQEIVDSVIADVQHHAGSAPPADDMALLVVKRV